MAKINRGSITFPHLKIRKQRTMLQRETKPYFTYIYRRLVKSLIEEKEISNWDLKIAGQCFKNFDLRDVNSLPGFKNYSGKSSYSATITIAKLSGEFLINLGQIGEVAELKVNGKLVGRTIEQNSTFAITPFLKVGPNKIETVNNLAI